MADGTTADFEDDEKPGQFRDPHFFLDYLPTGEDPRGEEGYALGGEERLDDMVLDLMGEAIPPRFAGRFNAQFVPL